MLGKPFLRILTDDLADTPEDERRISQAEKAAKKAIESKKAAKSRKRFSSASKPAFFEYQWSSGPKSDKFTK